MLKWFQKSKGNLSKKLVIKSLFLWTFLIGLVAVGYQYFGESGSGLAGVFEIKQALAKAKSSEDIIQEIGWYMATLVKFLIIPTLMILNYIGQLLDNRFILDGIMLEMLKDIWVLMRDIVNVIFVLVLLVLAFMNVVKSESTSWWELKTMLPKIVIALVAVNFSWGACKLMLDASNVWTAAVLTIPQSLPTFSKEIKDKTVVCSNYTLGTKDMNDTIVGWCKPDMTTFLKEKKLVEEVEKGIYKWKEDPKLGEMLDATADMDKIKFKDILPGEVHPLVTSFAFGVLRLPDLVKNDVSSKKILELGLDTFFGILLAIIYFIVFASLFVVLLARVMIIWLVFAFSPLYALHFVLWDKINLSDKLGWVKIVHEFFMPMLVSIPLVIGYIMTIAGQKMIADTSWTEVHATTLFDGMFGWYALMWKIMVVVILWIWVFAAMDESIAKGAVGTIKGLAQRAGQFTLRGLRYAPIFPVKVDGKKRRIY